MAGSTPGPKPKKRRPLTARERKLVDFLALHPDATLTEAGKFAGYADKNTAQRVYDSLHRESVREEMQRAMEADQDLCNEMLRIRLKEGLRSKQKVRSFDKMGNLVEEFADDDMQTRRAYLQLIGRWKGLEAPTQTEISGPNGGPIPTESIEALRGLSKEDLVKLLKVLG